MGGQASRRRHRLGDGVPYEGRRNCNSVFPRVPHSVYGDIISLGDGIYERRVHESSREDSRCLRRSHGLTAVPVKMLISVRPPREEGKGFIAFSGPAERTLRHV